MNDTKNILLKKVTCLCCAAVMSFAALSAFAAEYADMPDDWSRESLEWAAELGIITGDGGYIYPDSYVTRAQLAAMLARTFGFAGNGTGGFAGVAQTDWFAPYVSAAAEYGFMGGSGGLFRPNDNVTRQEAIAAIARAFSVAPSETELDGFADAGETADWAKGYFAALTERGVISGNGNMLYPLSNITKKETAAVIKRCAELPELPVRESDGSLWTPVY